MKFFVPEIGSRVKLTEDWTFHFYLERRNKDLLDLMGWQEENKLPIVTVANDYFCFYKRPNTNFKFKGNHILDQVYLMTLPKGSELQVDRLYVRKQAEDFSSLTFVLLDTPDQRFVNAKKKQIPFNKGKMLGRFWAKLEDVNAVEFDLLYDAVKSVNTRVVATKGSPLTFGEFKKELGKRKTTQFWIEYKKNGKELIGTAGLRMEKQNWVRKDPKDWNSDFVPVKPKNWVNGDSVYVYNPDEIVYPEIVKNQANSIHSIPDISKNVLWDNKDLLEDVDLDGGKLTICRIEEKEITI